MLGRLLSSASSAATSPSATRPSTAVGHEGEDYYTRTLLYPDSISLSNNQSLSGSGFISSSGSSVDGDSLDVDPARDVRLLIAQDGESKAIIFDSKPGVNFSNPSSRNYPSTFSGFEEFAAPISPGLGSFSRRRRSPMPYSSYPNSTLVTPKDEWTVLTECMFGTMPMSYKGTSTKLHILPTVASDKSGSSTPVSDGRYKGKTVPAPLGPQCQPSPYGHTPSNSGKDRKSVLITRLFSVAIPTSPSIVNFAPPPSNDQTPTPSGSMGNSNGFPFPKMTPNQQANHNKSIKGSKKSMYAIGLVISLPAPSPLSTKRCPHCFTLQYESEARRASTGEFCCDIAAASLDDEQRTDSVCVEVAQELGIADEQMEVITKHWDIITRALNDLQTLAESRIADALRNVGIISPNSSQPSYKYRRKIELRQGALMYDEAVRNEVERLKWRIVSGMKIPRVVTGQGRWSSWRDEARWINKRFGGKEQKFLFLTLLTAFLGHHTEWLEVLGPAKYRRAHQLQKQASMLAYEDSSLPSRTVIISNDKITARKLIYLLSAFLPAKTTPSWSELEASFMPSRISSSNILSQSPPVMSFMSRSSKDSLRRRPRRRPSKLSMMHGDAGDEGVWDMPMDLGAAGGTTSLQHHPYDSSLQLPVQGLGSVRKASTTVHPTPVATTAATKYGDLSLRDSRPGSSGSSASFSLVHVLRRSGTGNASTDSSGTGTSGWSFLSHIWPQQRGSTRCTTETSVSYHDDVLESPNMQPLNATGISEKYDEEAVVQDHDLYPGYDDSILSPPRFDPAYFHRAFHQDTPLSYSVAEDGVIDVDVPIAPVSSLNPTVFGNSTGNSASPIGSPGSVGYNFSLLSLDRSSLSLPSSLLHSSEDGQEPATNVAGWIEDERFHPDFTLQAVKPYAELEAEIKHSMRMEPTPKKNLEGDGLTEATQQTDDWVKVCSTLIADTRSCTIRKLTLLRRRLPLETFNGARSSPTSTNPSFGSSIPSSFMLHRRRSSTATFIPIEEDLTAAEEERFDDELVMDMDDILATAVERAIGVDHETHSVGNMHIHNGHTHQPHQPHQAGLRTPSRGGGPTSTMGKSKVSFSREPSVPSTPEHHGGCTLGSECKGLVLGALEEVVRRCVAAVDLKGDPMGPPKGPAVVENVLTEGVETWLNIIKGY